MPPPEGAPAPEAVPDRPRSFSYKTSWFAVSTDDTAGVATTLRLVDPRPANWKHGVHTAYLSRPSPSKRLVFVTPPVSGWTLAMGALPDPTMPQFSRPFGELAQRFHEVQFYGNHRVADYCAWARAIGGKMQRVFVLGNGEVMRNEGLQTLEEASLGLAGFSGLEPDEANSRIADIYKRIDEREEALISQGTERREARRMAETPFPRPVPDEEDVLKLADKWSVDPRKFDFMTDPLGVGILGQLPKDEQSPSLKS